MYTGINDGTRFSHHHPCVMDKSTPLLLSRVVSSTVEQVAGLRLALPMPVEVDFVLDWTADNSWPVFCLRR